MRKIAEGGCAEIYKARKQPYNNEVAIKVLHEQHLKHKRLKGAIQQEAQILGRLKHPNIIGFGRLVAGAERPSIELELFDATHLKQYCDDIREELDEGEEVPVSEIAVILQQVCAALEYLHELGVIHRDVKPQNILVNEAGLAKLIDFTIATELKKGWFAKKFKKGPPPEGTPKYISPEQILGKDPDHRADIYALCVTAFEAFSGKPPFHHEDPEELLKLQVKSEPPALGDLCPGLPRDLCAIIDRGLKKKPEERPADVKELRDVFAPYC